MSETAETTIIVDLEKDLTDIELYEMILERNGFEYQKHIKKDHFVIITEDEAGDVRHRFDKDGKLYLIDVEPV